MCPISTACWKAFGVAKVHWGPPSLDSPTPTTKLSYRVWYGPVQCTCTCMYKYLPLCVYTCINFMWVYCLVGLSVTNNVNLLNCLLTTSAVFCCLDCTSVFWLVLLSTYLSSAVLWVRPVFWLVTQRMRSLGSTSQLCELSHSRYGALLKIFTFFLHIITFLPPICCVNLYSTCADLDVQVLLTFAMVLPSKMFVFTFVSKHARHVDCSGCRHCHFKCWSTLNICIFHC